MSKLTTFYITNEDIEKWKPLAPRDKSLTDCAINVLSFFKIIEKKNATDLAELRNSTKTGVQNSEIVYFMNNKYPNLKYSWIHAENQIEKIPSSHGIIAWFENSKDRKIMGHLAIIARSNEGHFFLLDPQSNKLSFINEINFKEYLNRNNWDKVFTLYEKPKSQKKKTGTKRIRPNSISISKTRSNNKTKKTRNSQSPMTSLTKKLQKLNLNPTIDNKNSRNSNVDALIKQLERLKI